MFTGDRSGDWIYRALYKAGIASQPTSESLEDGLILTGALICAVAHCAPPDNKPTPDEIQNCSVFLLRILGSRHWKSILCLGGIAWEQSLRRLGEPRKQFKHGQTAVTAGGTTIIASYHPSQQNTFTGRLTEEMLDDAVGLWLHV